MFYDKKNLLIVDDDLNQQSILQIYGKDMGYNCTSCFNGEEGYFYAMKNFDKINFILMDFLMPKMNGLNAMLLIKQNLLTSSIPVIMMSSDQLELKNCFFLRKPFKAQELKNILNLLNNKTIIKV